ncbi:MAG: 3-isopropylmalate/(R)-2-methylmalate dehydratase small subunit [Thermoanaerobacteraceae bacterium]|jgi:3-isopropylmalate/(R)-2-methylmalate dehydratase small subunit|nr:3-isopropylmalate dehydratase, small subunit [Peptococcaceae bacterium]MDK2879954.1 3-isopropylmalate/(R)-2-methylmalate dehydratase small subunit [Thermoanaerobacteraceae bacterium]
MADFIIRGRALKFGDNINTDLISPARYMELSYKEIAAHAMEGADLDFVKKLRPGDIIVAGRNFGSGSSRETAPIALKYAGVGAVIADFFARIFYRNAINIGLPVFESSAASLINEGDELEVDALTGVIRNITQKSEYRALALPQHIIELIKAGGLIGYLESKFRRDQYASSNDTF